MSGQTTEISPEGVAERARLRAGHLLVSHGIGVGRVYRVYSDELLTEIVYVTPDGEAETACVGVDGAIETRPGW